MPKFTPNLDFDSLAPTTTKGDTIVRYSGGNARFPVGSDGTVPTADSSVTLGIKWASVSSLGSLDVKALAGATALTTSNNIVMVSGTTFAVTLFDLAGNSGREVQIIKTDDATTAQSIIGATTTHKFYGINGQAGLTLATQNEGYKLIAGQSFWLISQHWWDTGWTVVGGISVLATTTAPTKGTSIIVDKCSWRRVGSNAEVKWEHATWTNTGAAAGTGDYLFVFPPQLFPDMTNLVGYSTTVGNNAQFKPTNNIGFGTVSGGTDSGLADICMYNATLARGFKITSTNTGALCATANENLANTNFSYALYVNVPIKGWGG